MNWKRLEKMNYIDLRCHIRKWEKRQNRSPWFLLGNSYYWKKTKLARFELICQKSSD